MPVQAAKDWATIIALPVSKMQTDAILDQYSIFLSFASDEELSKFRIDQDQIVVVRPKSLPPDPGCQAGGGRNTFRLDPVITVSVWNRLWTDQAGQDTQWMHNASLGMAVLQVAVMTSLEQWMPVASDGTYYLIQPMRLMPAGWTFPIKRVGEWGLSSAEFFMPFQQSFASASNP